MKEKRILKEIIGNTLPSEVIKSKCILNSFFYHSLFKENSDHLLNLVDFIFIHKIYLKTDISFSGEIRDIIFKFELELDDEDPSLNYWNFRIVE